MTADQLYSSILEGKRLMLDNYHGMTLSPNGEFIRVQGHGSWAFRTEDKSQFVEEVKRLSEQHASGSLDDYNVNQYPWQA